MSKQHLPVEESNDHRNSNKLVYSIKVEDSSYASVDIKHASPSSDVPCSSISLGDEIRRVNPKELLRIHAGATLSDLSINMAQKMIKKQFPKLNGLISTLVQEKKYMYKPTKNQLQIIHSRDDHWIVASSALSKNNENEVHIYDLALSTIDERTKGIICNLFTSGNIVLKICQKQCNSEDCSLFAIANATLIANGIDSCSAKLIDHLLRAHLTKCFDKGIMTLFPCTI